MVCPGKSPAPTRQPTVCHPAESKLNFPLTIRFPSLIGIAIDKDAPKDAETPEYCKTGTTSSSVVQMIIIISMINYYLFLLSPKLSIDLISNNVGTTQICSWNKFGINSMEEKNLFREQFYFQSRNHMY